MLSSSSMIGLLAESNPTNGTYPSLVNSMALIVVAILQGFSMWRTGRNHRISHIQLKDVKEAAVDIKKSVDGPLGIALASAASAQEALARITQDPTRILEAVAARKLSDDHNSSQAVFLAAIKRSEDEKKTIIEEFLEKQKDTTNE